MKHQFGRLAPAIAALTAICLAGCGGSGDSKTGTATAAQTQTTATATATATAPKTQTETGTGSTKAGIVPRPAGQREASVNGSTQSLKAGPGASLELQVVKVADPVVAYVDRAKPGDKLVGVFVKGTMKGVIEPTRTTSVTTLKTSEGTIAGLRIIADGDCGGGFSPNDLLISTKTRTGCIGFEVPKSATPESITIAVRSPSGTQQATWKLPKAN